MADLRVNDIGSELAFDLKVMALDKQTTVRQLVIDILRLTVSSHMISMGKTTRKRSRKQAVKP